MTPKPPSTTPDTMQPKPPPLQPRFNYVAVVVVWMGSLWWGMSSRRVRRWVVSEAERTGIGYSELKNLGLITSNCPFVPKINSQWDTMSNRLMSKESTSRRRLGQYMRPNIQISHELNGRVKDYAAENDMTADEAYREIIETGLEELSDNG